MKRFFQAVAILFSVLFAWAGYLQHNDPDALLWYFIYGGAALSCIAFATGKMNFSLSFLMALTYMVGAFFSSPEEFQGVTIGQGAIKNIEQAREALGLLICSTVFMILTLRLYWLRKNSQVE